MSSESPSSIKNAASLLMKGGTLTGEPCEKCGGVVIKFANKTTCISCGAEKPQGEVTPEEKPSPNASGAGLQSSVRIIEEKIARLVEDIGREQDLSAQKVRAELLETYLRILEKVRNMGS